jgi:hypothetical protein
VLIATQSSNVIAFDRGRPEATPELDTTLLVQMALFALKGVWRLRYWYELYPVHGLILASVVAAVARQRTLPPPKEERLVRGRDTRPDRYFERSATLREVQHRHGDAAIATGEERAPT